MANWSNPQLTSTYTNFLAEVKDRDVDLALQFDGTTSTNIPTNAIRWDSSANRWKKWSGSVWGELTATYALTALSLTGSITFEGATDDAYETTLTVVDPTADRTITLPDITGIVVTSGDTATVTNTMLAGSIADSKLSTIATTDKVSLSAVNIDGATDIGAALADADLFIVDDGGAGTNRKAAATRITDYAFGKITGDITIASNGASAIGSSKVTNGMLAGSIEDSKLNQITTASKVSGAALTGTIPSTVLGNSTAYVGTTAVALNRASANQDLTGITSVAMPGSTSGTITLTPAATAGTTAITIPATSGTLVTTNDSGTVTSTMIADGTIVNADVNASAAIAGSKISPDFGSQNTTTTGTSTAASFIPTGATVPSNGIYLPAANQIGIATNSTQWVRITSTGDVNIKGAGTAGSTQAVSFSGSAPVNSLVVDASGNLGLGVTPSAWRNIFNAFQVGYTGSVYALTVSNATEQINIASNYYQNSAGNELRIQAGFATRYRQASGEHIWSTAASSTAGSAITFTQAMTLDANGRLLVGTTTSRIVEDLLGNGPQGLIQIEAVNSDAIMSIISAGTSDAGRAGTLSLGRHRNSTVGGTPTIVQSGDTLGAICFAGGDGTDMRTKGASIACQVDGTPGADDMPGRLVFSTTADGASSPTERMRINNTGFFANFASTDTGVFSTAAAAGTTVSVLAGYYGATANYTAAGTRSFLVWSNGNVQNTNNSYTGISDIKLKENIVDAGSQWHDLKALRVRNYNLKEGQTHRQIGLIAQEVEPISPGLVYESPDRDEDGNDLGTVTKSVNYSVLYMKAVKALQEAMERIETLEAKVAALEAA